MWQTWPEEIYSWRVHLIWLGLIVSPWSWLRIKITCPYISLGLQPTCFQTLYLLGWTCAQSDPATNRNGFQWKWKGMLHNRIYRTFIYSPIISNITNSACPATLPKGKEPLLNFQIPSIQINRSNVTSCFVWLWNSGSLLWEKNVSYKLLKRKWSE